MRDAILVLGRYNPPRAGRADDVPLRVASARQARLRITVCAFGPDEQACLLAAAAIGCDLRVGFENNLMAPDATPRTDNAAAVASLRAALHSHAESALLNAEPTHAIGVF